MSDKTKLLKYVLQDDLNNRLTPRVIDIAYTAFTAAKAPNAEDGGPSDWFNDTKPNVDRLIAKLRAELLSASSQTVSDATPSSSPAPADLTETANGTVQDCLTAIRDLASEMGHSDTLGFEEARERIIEHVEEGFRRLLSASPTPTAQGMGWQDIASAPRDGTLFLAAVRVLNNKTKEEWWEQHIISCDDGTGDVHSEHYQGWDLDDYSLWMPTPSVPSTSAGEA